MDEKKGGLTPTQVEKIQEAVSKLESKDHELLSDELDSVTGGVFQQQQPSEPVIICVSGCGGAA
jgi:hypothetical protein